MTSLQYWNDHPEKEMIQMVRKSLRERLNPKKTPTVFTTEKTNSRFINQMMMIIHPYYYNDSKKKYRIPGMNRLEIANYSHKIMSEYCKYRQDYHLHVDEEFDKDALYVQLENSKNMEFYNLLDCTIQILYDETRNDNRYVDYIKLTEEINDSMRINGVGYQIVEGRLTVQTEQKVFEEITNPCLLILDEYNFYEADGMINEAFDAYKEGAFEEAIIDACKALENVVFELCQMEELPITTKDNFPKMIRSLLKNEEDITNQLGEHSDSLYHLMQTAETIRNENAAHGKVVKNVSSSMARYVIDIVCSDILFLIRYFCEENKN